MSKKSLKHKNAQVWIENVIYILIGLTTISILLSMILPQIEKMKDKSAVEQTMTALNIINNKILEASDSSGSIRIIEFKMTKGKLTIDSENNKINYVLENTRLESSEVGQKIKQGDLTLETEANGKRFNVILTLDYNNKFIMTYNKEKINKIIQGSSGIYKIQIENLGYNEPEQKTKIDFNTA
jgi:type II secretory pathway pseudopilin PulG